MKNDKKIKIHKKNLANERERYGKKDRERVSLHVLINDRIDKKQSIQRVTMMNVRAQ